MGGNLGLDAITAPGQSVALLFTLVVFHAWSRGGLVRINALEAAGATIAVGSCLLVYGFRGNQPYSSLRSLGWYHTLPQIGAILFAAGWWTAVAAPKPGRMTLGQAAGVFCLVIIFCMIQIPRARQHLIDEAPLRPGRGIVVSERSDALGRALYFKAEYHDLQHRALARLDMVNRLATTLGASPETLREIFGRILVPGIHEKQAGCDCFSLLIPRPRNSNAVPELVAHKAELIELLRSEPEPASSLLSRTIQSGKRSGRPQPARRRNLSLPDNRRH